MSEDIFGKSFLPIAKRVFATTIAQDLIEVKPLGGGNSWEETKKIENEVKSENRDRKIESLVDDKDYEEMKIEEHPDYKTIEPPRCNLFYMDMVYTSEEDKKK